MCIPDRQLRLEDRRRINASFDKKTLQRFQEIENMDPDFKKHLFSIIDSVIRITKHNRLTHKKTASMGGCWLNYNF
ncbi:hypothetical protein EI546_09665 [Aequorivita sp. H23M31]|uniref:Uncharacterized protein n=1 Tax=Aequorivita ciconiae TaxID=2494375 RepID=A0A410G3Z0_9FLAO|nr:hypothetical protein [Aequorivita sp. H23M31]QAA81973.1 hypothetical protein EI546_09665 [Aequorivita sp. H23M31]